MPRKLTYEEVKHYIEVKSGSDYKLLSKEYINNSTPLEILCNKGHKYNAAYGNFQQGQRCPLCHGEQMRLDRRTPESTILKMVHDGGYEFVEWVDAYKNRRSKIILKCPQNHVYETSAFNFKSGNRCPKCLGHIEFTYDGISKFVNENADGYRLLDMFHKFSGGKRRSFIAVLCNNNHKYEVQWDSFKKGVRCPKCKKLEMSAKFRLDYEYVASHIGEYGYQLLSKDYINAKQKLEIRCDNNHIFFDSFDNFKNNSFCPICKIMNRVNPSIIKLLREQIIDWKKLSTSKHKYKCVLTGSKFHHVHHLQSFDKIVKEVFNNLNIPYNKDINEYAQKELLDIINTFDSVHNQYPLGVPLHEKIHTLFHQEYGYGNNTPEQFEEFKTRLKQSEFNDFLEENNLELVI